MLRPVPLARAQTPLEPLGRASARLGAEVWIKRDDLTGSAMSGNKVRKLEYLLAEALAQGADTVITCGGIQSNHARATAFAARRLGLAPALLLRGAPPAVPEANLLLDMVLGAELRWVDMAGWRERDARMAAWAGELRAAGRRPYVIPEGGSNAAGSLGYVRAGRELAAQALAEGLRFDTVIVATGSGGTLAGLAMAGLDARVLGVAVCDDEPYFRGRVRTIAAEAARFALSLPPCGERWDVLGGYQGAGYARTRPEEIRAWSTLAREEGVLLDPVYTGKAWYALVDTLAREPGVLGERILFWHTGGAFGLFGRGAEITAALGADT
jgi:D-cysteine desulfhydrase